MLQGEALYRELEVSRPRLTGLPASGQPLAARSGTRNCSPGPCLWRRWLDGLEGRQMTAAQQQMQDRCAAYQQRQMAKDSAAGGFRSLFVAQGYLDRWGRERVAGIGCSCADLPARRAADSRSGARLPQHRSRRGL